MYAIVDDGGRQLRVEKGQELEIDYRGDSVAAGDVIDFPRVLTIGDGKDIQMGSPALSGARVSAEVLGPSKGPKLVVQKFRRRKTFRRKNGHRQLNHLVRITGIHASGG